MALPQEATQLVELVQSTRLPDARARRRIRQEADVSLREMARALGVDPMTVARWEAGTTPRREHALAYRQLLDALQRAAE